MNATRTFFLLACLVGPLPAGTIFSDFGTDPSYTSDASSFVDGGVNSFSGLIFQSLAVPFTPTTDSVLAQVDLALTYYAVSDSAALVSLRSDNGGFPGAALMSWTVGNLSPYPTCCPIVSLFATAPLLLSGGTTYWLQVDPAAPTTLISWDFNNTGASGNWDFYLGSDSPGNLYSQTYTLPAFDVLSTPEPASVALVALGLALASVLRARSVRRDDQ